MGIYVQILAMIIAGVVLLWFGFFLFFGPPSPFYPYMPWAKDKYKNRLKSTRNSQYCPVCSYKMVRGELVKTIAFPLQKSTGDRLMHIRGCYNCLEDKKPRKCPICKSELSPDDFLIARMFERPGRKNHVHVLGCNHCRMC